MIDKTTGEPLIGVNVYIKDTTIGGATDSRGVFYIHNIPQGEHELMVTMMGYRTMLIKGLVVNEDKYRILKIKLAAKILELGGVEITAEKPRQVQEEKLQTIDREIIEPRQIKHQIGTLDDYYRAVVNLPSVAQRNDYSPQLYIRGGSPDQNLIMYDGIEILIPTRMMLLLGGGISLVNPDMISDLELSPGGFGVEFGNKLSGMLQINNRDGNKEFSIKTGLSPVSSHACFEGPLLKGRGSWILAGRRSFYDMMANRIIQGNNIFPYYHDVHFKTSFFFKPDHKISLFYANLGEGAQINGLELEEMDILNKGSGHIAGLNYGIVLNKKLAFHSLAGYYEDLNDIKIFDMNNHSYNARLKYHFKRISFKSNLLYYPSEWLHIKSGITTTKLTNYVRSQIDWRSWINLPDNLNDAFGDVLTAGYTQLSIQNKELSITTGIRYDYSEYYKQALTSPRIKFTIFPSEKFSFWTSHGLYTQFPDVMTIISRGTPMDLSQNKLKAEQATHHIAGCDIRVKPDMILKLETFQKSINEMLTQRENTYIPENNGIGSISGIELTFQKSQKAPGSWGFHLNYALYSAKYRLKDQNKWFYFDHDQRHRLSAGLIISFKNGFIAGMNYHFGSGYPHTPVLGMQQTKGTQYDYVKGWQLLEGEINSSRYPYYSRLDVRFQYRYLRFSVYLDIINVLNNQNVYLYEWDFWLTHNTGIGTKTVYNMMPILPTIGCSFEL
ncbi:TonB-dependent receptor [candidate division KSB1 bacterium]|nr:TonB-dependent receptor [candidate division KSB1 bacterium]